MRRLFLTLLAALAALVLPPAPAAAAEAWRATPDDALLFDVRLGQYRMGDGTRGYQTPDGVCVDLGDLILALDLPIRLDKQSRRATGWAWQESRTIVVDRNQRLEQIMNKKQVLRDSDIRDTPEGWCVALATASRWLGVTLQADTGNALLWVKSERKLPPELAAERRTRVPVTRATFDLAKLPQADQPYRGVPAPALDVVASAGAVADRVAGSRRDLSYELYASGEAGPVSYDARLAAAQTGLPQSLRVRAYRYDPGAQLLGPLRATQVAAGDVVGLATPLVAQPSLGRGASISNRPLDRPLTFDRTSLSGELPRGWDAELYRNGQLLAVAAPRGDGRYEFDDIQLLFGENRLEVVLYGPQGQIRRQVTNVPVGLDAVPAGKTWWWASVDEDGRDLIQLPGAASVFRQGWRVTAGGEYGLDQRTSVAAYVHRLTLLDGSAANYVEAAARHAFGSALAEVSAAQQLGGGYALRGQVLANLGATQLNGETIWTHNYVSDRILSGVTGVHTLAIDTRVGAKAHVIPLHFDLRWLRRNDGQQELDGYGRASFGWRRLAFTAEGSWRRYFASDGTTTDQAGVGLLASGRVGPVRVRGEAQFQVKPATRLDSASVVAEWDASRDPRFPASWRGEAGWDGIRHRARAALGWVRRFDHLAFNVTGEAASDGSVAVGVGLAFSIGRDPRGGHGLRVTSQKLASRGTALVRVFRDLNGNGVHDPGEPWEPGVGVAAGQAVSDSPTDRRGELVIDGLEPFRPTLLSVDAGSLNDPSLEPEGPGVVVTPRPGRSATVELALAPAGDVEGTLVKEGGGALAGIDLELVDASGRTAKTVRTDFDGYFVFERVAYGRYQLRLGVLAAAAARLQTELGRALEVSAQRPNVKLGAVAARPTARLAQSP